MAIENRYEDKGSYVELVVLRGSVETHRLKLDPEDVIWAENFKWLPADTETNGVVYRYIYTSQAPKIRGRKSRNMTYSELFRRTVWPRKPKKLRLFHRNKDSQDFRRDNLALMSRSDIQLLSKPYSRTKHDLPPGVIPDGNLFRAQVGYKGQVFAACRVGTPEKAHNAYLQVKHALYPHLKKYLPAFKPVFTDKECQEIVDRIHRRDFSA